MSDVMDISSDMTALQFKIILCANNSSEPSIYNIKQYIERFEVKVKSIDKLNPDFSIPNFPEWVYDVKVEKHGYGINTDKTFMYEDLCYRWCSMSPLLDGHRPLFQLSEDECFSNKWKFTHMLENVSVSLGVHPKFGKYISYHTISSNSKVSFSHDIRELRIGLPNSCFCTVRYSCIRNLLFSVENGYVLYIDLLHPPIHFTNLKGGQRTDFRNVERAIVGKSHILCLKFKIGPWLEILSCLRLCCEKLPVHVLRMETISRQTPLVPKINFPNFGCMYIWTALIERSFTFIEQVNDMDISSNIFFTYAEENPLCFEKALTEVLFMVDCGQLVNYCHCIDVLFKYYQSQCRIKELGEVTVPPKTRLIRRITVTPTRLLLWPADLMNENRILRNFDSDYFIRLIFRDDDMLMMNVRSYDDDTFNEVIKTMNSGLRIGNRLYELLAWSNSQLREHGVSMYARDIQGNTAHAIRQWTEMNPHTNMSIPKCLARIGQCFSQTEDPLHVEVKNVQYENDIEGGFNPVTRSPYCFSDGVGKISISLVEKIVANLKHTKNSSAFQIRYSGCKGMLVVDPNLKNCDVVFRNSMRKFDCSGKSHLKLEIAQRSVPISVHLNRPLIAILHDLGVPSENFLRLQEDMLQNVTDMLLEEEKAADYLHSRLPFQTFNVLDLTTSGILLTVEPFYRMLLLALHKYYIDLIKCKANIDIHPDKARNMFGVLDETGTLQYGEVFVQYSTDISLGITTPDDTKILTGTVMVTKCPCVHAADVRKFNAVDVPDLHHIIDCIVFPQKGHRPHPDEMAGSDLDGDMYTVIWEEELFFQGDNVEPPNFPKPVAKEYLNVSSFLLHSNTEEITNFLVSYIKNDTIGSIATHHLAHADATNIQNDICNSLALKHSIAVDFPKSGVSEKLEPHERARKFPDFMEKFDKPKYKSKKSLGIMYRVSRDFENETQTSLEYHNIKVDEGLVVDGWNEYESKAVESKNKYNSILKTILQTYGIEHETEAFGGAFIRLHNRFQVRRDKTEIIALVRVWLTELIDKTRSSFFEGLKHINDVKELELATLRQASAWYIVTYRERNPEFLSFPWVMSQILSNIRVLKYKLNNMCHTPSIPLIPELEKVILLNDSQNKLPVLNVEAQNALNSYHIICDFKVVKNAIRVLSKWADDERIISNAKDPGKLLFYDTFLSIILYVAEKRGFISKTESIANPHFTSADLVLFFFKYCMKLRFLSKEKMKSVLPFFVYNDRRLAKRSLLVYHSLAISGSDALFTQDSVQNSPENINMKPYLLDISIFGLPPIKRYNLNVAQSILLELTGVRSMHLRELTVKKKIVVSAYGTPTCINHLQQILRKDNEELKILFETRNFPPERDFQ